MFHFLTNIAKYVILTVNFLFMVLALLLITFGVLPIVYGGYDSTYGIIAIVIGAVVFIVSFLGCCGAAKENTFLLSAHGVILAILFVVLIVLGILAAVAIGNGSLGDSAMDDFLNDLFHSKNSGDVETFHDIERWFKCCGVHDYTDYDGEDLPGSCCGEKRNTWDDGERTCNENLAYKVGCDDELSDFIQNNYRWLSIIAICLGIFEITGSLFTFWTVRHLKKKHHDYH